MRYVAIGGLAVAGVRVVRGEDPVPAPGALDHLGQNLPPGRLIQRCESLDCALALRRGRDSIVVARDEEPAAVQVCGECDGLLDWAKGHVTEVEDD